MQVKVYSVLIIAIFMLLVVMPASAYDYRGVPRPGDNNPDTLESDAGIEEEVVNIGDEDLSADLSPVTGSSDFASLIMMILAFFLQLLGISVS